MRELRMLGSVGGGLPVRPWFSKRAPSWKRRKRPREYLPSYGELAIPTVGLGRSDRPAVLLPTHGAAILLRTVCVRRRSGSRRVGRICSLPPVGHETSTLAARPEAEAPWLYNCQAPRQSLQHVGPLEQAFDKRQDERCSRVPRDFKDDDAGVIRGRIVANVCEAEVSRDETPSLCPGVGRDCRVSSAAQVGIADINGVVAVATKDGCGRAGQVCIDEKTHPGHSLVGKA